MAAETKGTPVSKTNVLFFATLAWFVILAGAAAVISGRPGVDPLFPAAAFGLIALLAPITLMQAWKIGHPGGAVQERQMAELIRAVETLAQEGGLSEGAKQVLHRRQERDLLCRAIEQDITDEDWDAAMVLVKELAERFGYRADAEEFRTRIERARAQTLDRKVIEALAGLDEMIRRRHWAESFAEAARITRLYPDSHRVDNLRQRVDDARHRYRKDLERRFLIAAEGEHVEQAMELLRELDSYLTQGEAEPFQEVARGVIGKLRENLGVRFKLAVQDHLWNEAVAVGEKITAEFPNTRMAQEVRELMPMLRERAEGRARVPAARAG